MKATQVVLLGKVYDLTPAEDGPGLQAVQPVPDIAGMIRRTVPESETRDRLLARFAPAAFVAEVLAEPDAAE